MKLLGLLLSLLAVGGESVLRGNTPDDVEQDERNLQSTGSWYPVYTNSYSTGFCSDATPIPDGRNRFTSQLLCCGGAFPDQSSNFCLSQLPNPPTRSPNAGPTTSPTSSPTTTNVTVWYPDYNGDYNLGVCTNAAPLPNGRPTYSDACTCCSFAYAGQSSGACNTAGGCTTTTSNSTFTWYPVFGNSYDAGTCVNSPPAPAWRNTNGVSIFSDQRTCCDTIFKDQGSGTCLVGAPTASPTAAADATPTPSLFYPVWSSTHNLGFCDNDNANRPASFVLGSTLFNTQAECCAAWFQFQPRGGLCVTRAPSDGTLAPTVTPVVYWYPRWGATLADGRCLNDNQQGSWMTAPDYLFTDAMTCCETHFPATDNINPPPFGISPCLLGAGFTNTPTTSPTSSPTSSPTTSPTKNPTKSPTTSPTKNPTRSPTAPSP